MKNIALSTILRAVTCLIVVAAVCTTQADAQTRKRQYSSPFGMAGCGLGSVIITEKDKQSQIFASVINVYIGFVSSSITSGTSNCNYFNPTAQLEQKVYIAANLRSLEKEAVQGDGMHLDALATLFGCDEEEGKTLFIDHNKTQFTTIYSSGDPEKVFESLRSSAEGEVVRSCPGLS